ncbi:unnamed protein product [Musa textilis]
MAAAETTTTTAAADQAPQPSPMALYVGGPRTGRRGGSTLWPLFLRRRTRFRPGLQEPRHRPLARLPLRQLHFARRCKACHGEVEPYSVKWETNSSYVVRPTFRCEEQWDW